MSSDEYSFSVVYYSILYVPPAHPSVLVYDDQHYALTWVAGLNSLVKLDLPMVGEATGLVHF